MEVDPGDILAFFQDVHGYYRQHLLSHDWDDNEWSAEYRSWSTGESTYEFQGGIDAYRDGYTYTMDYSDLGFGWPPREGVEVKVYLFQQD